MPNPRPTQFSTGNLHSRHSLRATVSALRSDGMNWTAIGKQVGVSSRTAKRCHAELEAHRKQARAIAYAAEQRARTADIAQQQASTLPTAIKIFGALALTLILVALAIRFFG